MSFDPNVLHIKCYDTNFHQVNPNSVLNIEAKQTLTKDLRRGYLYLSTDKKYFVEIPDNTPVPVGFEKIGLKRIVELANQKIGEPYAAFGDIIHKGLDIEAATNIVGILNWNIFDPAEKPSGLGKVIAIFRKTDVEKAYAYYNSLMHAGTNDGWNLLDRFKVWL